MTTVHLLDESGASVATIAVDMMTMESVQGKVIAQTFTEDMIRVFNAFQEMVEHQMFSLMDEISLYMDSLNLRVQIDDRVYPIYDLQVYDLTQISFQIESPDVHYANDHEEL